MNLRRSSKKIDPNRVYLGKLLKPHALKGEMKFQPFGCPIELMEMIETIHIEGSDTTLELEWLRGSDKNPILKFCGIDNRNQSDELSGAILWAEPDDLPELDEGFTYESDILYCQVETMSGEPLGRVEEILETGEHDVLVIRGRGQEHLIPAHPGTIHELHLDEQRIVVRPLEYQEEDPSA